MINLGRFILKFSSNPPCKTLQNSNVRDCVERSYLLLCAARFVLLLSLWSKSQKKVKRGYWAQISSLYGHYLLIVMLIPGATKSCHLDVLWKQMVGHCILNYMFPYLLEKHVLEIRRKVIFTVACSSVCQITAQVGRGAPPCRWRKARRHRRRLYKHLACWKDWLCPKICKYWGWLKRPLQRSVYNNVFSLWFSVQISIQTFFGIATVTNNALVF